MVPPPKHPACKQKQGPHHCSRAAMLLNPPMLPGDLGGEGPCEATACSGPLGSHARYLLHANSCQARCAKTCSRPLGAGTARGAAAAPAAPRFRASLTAPPGCCHLVIAWLDSLSFLWLSSDHGHTRDALAGDAKRLHTGCGALCHRAAVVSCSSIGEANPPHPHALVGGVPLHTLCTTQMKDATASHAISSVPQQQPSKQG